MSFRVIFLFSESFSLNALQGKTKVEVAKMIQNTSATVTITYNKLHADPKQGRPRRNDIAGAKQPL